MSKKGTEMIKKLFLLVLVVQIFVQVVKASESIETLTSNRLYQHWLEWESGFDLAEQAISKNWPKPGNGGNFAWTQSPKIRSYGEIFSVTNDAVWLEEMAAALDVVYEYRADDIECNGDMFVGWENVAKSRHTGVHQGRILTAFLEYVKYVRSLENPPIELLDKANAYEAFAIQVVGSLDQLYRTKVVGGKIVGYYLITGTKQVPDPDKPGKYKTVDIPCGDGDPKYRIAPHNQSLSIGIALDLLVQLGNTGLGYETKVKQLATGLKHDLVTPPGGQHYEWPYWPSFSEVYKGGNDKAEDHGHAQIDLEFVVSVYEQGYKLGDNRIITSSDISRFVSTMTNKVNRGYDYFALRVDGQVHSKPSAQSDVNAMKRGWALLGKYHRPLLDIGENWCANNSSHTNSTMLKLGGLELGCPGWCPSGSRASFDSLTAFSGWGTSTDICSGYGEKHHIDFDENDPLHGSAAEDPEAKLNARKGRGYYEVFEKTGSSGQSCNPVEYDSKDMAFFNDLVGLGGSENRIELAGFSRSKSSTNSSSSVTNRSVFFMDKGNYGTLSSNANENFEYSSDSHWRPFNVSIEPNGNTNIRAVIGMRDSWGSDWSQSLNIDEVKICTSASCGNGFCEANESTLSCPSDCDSNLEQTVYGFNVDSENWKNPAVEGYTYTFSDGVLTAVEDFSGGPSGINPGRNREA